MCRHFLLISIFFSLVWMALSPQDAYMDADQIWERGKKAEARGEYHKALNIWESAKDSARPDPRIGIDYIELVTREQLKDYYKRASFMYNWGFSKSCISKHSDLLGLELERIKPLIPEAEYKLWKGYANNNLTRLCQEINKFWEQMDPTIPTEYNERLIEHWERIAYSRKHFNKNRSSVYGTDDRAIVYVKLGEPDLKRSGNLSFSQPMVRSWVNDVIDRQFRGGGSAISSGSDSIGSAGEAVGSNSESGMAQQSMAQLWARVDMADRYTKQAELLHRYQRYEIWIYDQDLRHSDENLVYIFGQDGDTGMFGLRKSLDEIIPGKAFRNRSSRGSLLRPGILLQLMYYQQFMHLDNYFADAFSNIESRLLVTNGLHRTTSMAIRDQNEHKLNYIQIRSPQQISNHLERMPPVKLFSFQYRFLDEKNRPYLATFLEGNSQKAYFFDQVKYDDFDMDAYKLVFNTRISSPQNEIIYTNSKTSKINAAGEGDVDEMDASVAYLKLPHKSKEYQQTFTAELYNKKKDESVIGKHAFPENLRAIGLIKSLQPEVLSTDYNVLEISDVIIGVEGQSSDSISTSFPGFKVQHDKRIPANKNLRLYFEVYHLEPDTASTNKFQVEYQLRPKSRNIFQRIFGSGDKVGLTLNFETIDTYYKSDLEIVTSSFKPGSYELLLRVYEPSTRREKTATLDMVIEES